MAKVLTDAVPGVNAISKEADLPRFSEEINTTLNRLNEILRLQSIGINTIEFGDGTTSENVMGEFVTVEFSTAGTELSATHTLGKAPVSIIGKKLDMPGEIYFSKAATTTSAYFKSDTDNLSGVIVIA